MKYVIHTLFPVLAALAVSCKHGGQPLQDSGSVRVKFSNAYANAPGAIAAGPEKIDRVNAYLCSGGVVKKVFTLEALGDLIIDEQYHFSDSKLYVVANDMACEALTSVVEGTAESIFEELVLTGEIKKVPLHGVVDLAGMVGKEVHLALGRSMARFDLVVDENRGIEVQSVSFEGLPTNGKLFGAGGDYSHRLNTDCTPNTQTSIEGLLYSYELPLSEGGAKVSLNVRYNGNLATLVVPIAELRRNYIYNLGVHAYDGKLTAAINSSTMGEGDTVTGGEAYTHTLIDEVKSTFVDDTKLLSPTIVRLPNKNCEIILALSGDYDKTFAIEGDPSEFEITPLTGGTYKNQKLKIKAAYNSNYGHGGRAVILVVSHVERGLTITDRISITQMTPEPFESVVMGGLEWFPFNALGKDWILYPKVQDGQSVRDVLKANWYKYGEACYQWGPRKSYNTVSPFYAWWVQGSAFNNINGPITAMPAGNIWQGESVPCPEGWRLPTYEECERIWAPHGTELPQTYTKQGVEYTMSLEESGLTVNLPVHGNRKLYNVVISNGTNELIFPAGGVRYENNVDHDGAINGFAAKVGSAFALRTQKAANNSGHNAGVGYAVQTQNINTPSKVVLTAGTHSITVGQTYCYIRCVRNLTR